MPHIRLPSPQLFPLLHLPPLLPLRLPPRAVIRSWNQLASSTSHRLPLSALSRKVHLQLPWMARRTLLLLLPPQVSIPPRTPSQILPLLPLPLVLLRSLRLAHPSLPQVLFLNSLQQLRNLSPKPSARYPPMTLTLPQVTLKSRAIWPPHPLHLPPFPWQPHLALLL